MKRLLSRRAFENKLKNRKKRSVVFLCAITVAIVMVAGVGSVTGENASPDHDGQKISICAVAEKKPEKKKKNPLPKVIVIDPGHQKKANLSLEPVGPGSKVKKAKVTGGARGVSTRVYEHTVNLQVAKLLKKSLEDEGYLVYLTRAKADVNISNRARALFATKKKAKLFIRLHCDSSERSSVKGFLTLTPAKNKWTTSIYDRSLKAAKIIHARTLKATGAKDRGIVKRGDLTGFNWSKVPVILLEMGVMSNPAEDKLLSRRRYQEQIVKGVTAGVNEYLKKK